LRHTIIPCKVRKIHGVRFGAIGWNSTLNVSRALELDAKNNLDFGAGAFPQSVIIFSNIRTAGIYAGGSVTWIKNMAVTFGQEQSARADGIVTWYADILYSHYLQVDDVQYQNHVFQTDILKLKSFGFRAGMDGKLNRKIGLGYGGEFGFRPAVAKMGWYAVLKFTAPLFGASLG
jgi:hypothetical protein